MNLQEQLPALRDTAVLMLPGFRQARAQLDIAVRVFEYFEGHAAHEFSTGRHPPFDPIDPALLQQIEELKSMLNAFCRIHGKKD